MATETTVPDDELLALLNRAFDGWGSAEYFDWKYGDFPGYDPATDDFVVTNDDGEVVAARRVFERELATPAGTATVHVHGGTVVDEPYRGRGHYSELLERSMAHSREHADHVVTFNRAGKITTEHHEKNGWRKVTLPVHTRVLSPSRVLAHYVLDSDLARTAADYVAPVDRRLTRSDAVSKLMARAADVVYGDDDGDQPDGDENNSGTSTAASEGRYDVTVVDGRAVPDDLVDELAAHLRDDINAPYHFGRSAETIRHAGRYPDASVYVARGDDGDLRDFLVAGALRKGGFTEYRVVEQTWSDPAAARRLFERLETDARRGGADVIVACSERRPAPDWVSLGTEYMMWPPDFGHRDLPESPSRWRLTAYDVL